MRFLTIAIAVFLLAILLSTAVWFYRAQEKQLSNQIKRDLTAIAQLKVDQIVNWREERLAEAAQAVERPFLRDSTVRWMANPTSEEPHGISLRFQSLIKHDRFKDVFLVDATGELLYGLGKDHRSLDGVERRAVEEAIGLGRPLMTDIHEGPGNLGPHVDTIAPIFGFVDGATRAVGAMVLETDANEYLYPLIQSWPTASETAESLLVRQDGDQVLFLNELRLQKNSPLSLRIPLTQEDLPASMAIRGHEGFVRGIDYRGKGVVAVLKAIPDSPWFLVAKMDEEEAFAAGRYNAFVLLSSILALILTASALAALVWQRYRKTQYQALYEAQQAHRKSEEKYRQLVESANSLIIRMDSEGKVIFFNEFAEEFFRYSRNEIVGRNVFGTILHEEDNESQDVRGMILEANRDKKRHIRVSLKNRRKDGSSVWVSWTNKAIRDESGQVTEFLCIGNDITEETLFNAERERLVTAIEQSTDIITVTDTLGNLTYANPSFARVTGFDCGKVIGKNTRFLKSGQHDKGFYENLWNTIKGGNVWTGRFVNKKKDGSFFTEDATISPVYDASGKIAQYVKVARDVTEELNRESQLQRAQRMEAVGQLAGGVAHDFNNLLQVISGYTQLEMMRTADGKNGRDNLEQIKSAAEKAAILTRQLLAFSKRQVLQPVSLDLNRIIADLMKMLNRLIGEHVRLEIKADSDLRPVLADPGQIEQIVINLAVNARDAMPEGGTITIQTENVTLDDSFCQTHPWTDKGDFALITFSDTGVGMTEEVKERLFEPFFSTKEPGKGTGLGLATVYGIVKQHNGSIHVYSELGRGTVFKIYLPAAVGEQPAVKKKTEAAVRGGTETILVAEDDQNVRGLVKTILEKSGYTVHVALDGADAIRQFEGMPEKIDLVLLDIVMPNLGGKSACDAMLEMKQDLKFIFCSGYNPDAFGKDFQIDERFEFIPKPFSPDDLLRKVRAVLDTSSRPA